MSDHSSGAGYVILGAVTATLALGAVAGGLTVYLLLPLGCG